LRRVRLLAEAGIIERDMALFDPAKVGMGLTVFARVWLTGQDEETVTTFVEAIKELPQVVAADLDAYRRFQIEHLARIKGIRNIKTDIPMQKIKHSWENSGLSASGDNPLPL
jgi:DNA-binding Lrp family transcriptional regulator